jgi:hypothetical protein
MPVNNSATLTSINSNKTEHYKYKHSFRDQSLVKINDDGKMLDSVVSQSLLLHTFSAEFYDFYAATGAVEFYVLTFCPNIECNCAVVMYCPPKSTPLM